MAAVTHHFHIVTNNIPVEADADYPNASVSYDRRETAAGEIFTHIVVAPQQQANKQNEAPNATYWDSTKSVMKWTGFAIAGGAIFHTCGPIGAAIGKYAVTWFSTYLAAKTVVTIATAGAVVMKAAMPIGVAVV